MEDYKEKMELPENIGMTTYASKIILTFQKIQVNLTEKNINSGNGIGNCKQIILNLKFF